MKDKSYRSLTAILLATAALSIASPVLAQRSGGAGPGSPGGSPGGSMSLPAPPATGTFDRTRDRDQIHDQDKDKDQDRDRDQLKDRDHDKLGDQDRDRDQLQDRDRLHVSQNVDGQLASWQLLSTQERQQLHNRIQAAANEQERNQIRSEYQNMVRQRARDLGVDAPFGPERTGSGARDGYYLAQMLTEQERLQFHERMRNANSEQERNRIRTEMRTMARQRAADLGIDMPAWYGQRLGQ